MTISYQDLLIALFAVACVLALLIFGTSVYIERRKKLTRADRAINARMSKAGREVLHRARLRAGSTARQF